MRKVFIVLAVVGLLSLFNPLDGAKVEYKNAEGTSHKTEERLESKTVVVEVQKLELGEETELAKPLPPEVTKPIKEAPKSALLATFAIPQVFTPNTRTPKKFDDLKDHWVKPDVEELAKIGIVEGYPDGSFKPDQVPTKKEALAIFLRTLESEARLTETLITYIQTKDARVSLCICDPSGKVARTLVNSQSQPAGEYSVVWNGRNDRGTLLPPGDYIYQVEAEDAEGNKSTLKASVIIASTESPTQATTELLEDFLSARAIEKSNPDPKVVTHVLERGQTLYNLAKKYNTTVAAIAKLNNIRNVNRIIWDSTLKIPVSSTTTPAQPPQKQFLTRGELAAMVARLVKNKPSRVFNISGAVSDAVEVSINGARVTASSNGDFQSSIALPEKFTQLVFVLKIK